MLLGTLGTKRCGRLHVLRARSTSSSVSCAWCAPWVVFVFEGHGAAPVITSLERQKIVARNDDDDEDICICIYIQVVSTAVYIRVLHVQQASNEGPLALLCCNTK